MLTTSQIEVIRWKANGKTTGEIAQIQNRSVNTVNSHIVNALKATDTLNMNQLIAHCFRKGWIE